ncbi:MAG: heme biosynthesis HemY N-terminal domain-containing protein, partial [Salaquimonas sp.]
MMRIFLFLILVLILGFGFSWFADRPGDVVLQWQGTQYETSLMVVLVAIVALVAAIMILWWLAKTILDSPRIMQRFFKARKKDRGYQALSRGLIAANSGDSASARKYTKESIKLLGQEPLVELLDAQSSLLEGNRDEARARFEKMLEQDETRLVALRGLYLEAERQGAGDAARHYAEEAHKSAPSLSWAGNAKLRYASKDGNWQEALAALEANKSAGLMTKDEAKRQRAVLLTAQAMSVEPADPVKAAKLAREAHKLAPTLVPAAIIGAKALARNSDIGRASGMLETVWKKEPHPEIAQSYIYLRMGDSAADRLKRARKLAAMKANHPEGNFIIAEAAIDVEDWKLARETMVPVLNTAPTQRACLIMADVEEGQSGDQGRMREWLARAVRAPKDAAWTADGYVSEKWLPISPVTGKIDAFEWKVPLEQLGGPSEAVLDSEGLEDLIREPEVAPIVVEAEETPPAKKPSKATAAAATAGGALAIG